MVALQVVGKRLNRLVPADPLWRSSSAATAARVTRQRVRGTRASGSGFVYSRTGDSGLIITNAHVVRPPNGATIVLAARWCSNDGDRVQGPRLLLQSSAPIWRWSRSTVTPSCRPPVEFADSAAGCRPASGRSPSASRSRSSESVSVGVVSGFNRDEPIGSDDSGAAPARVPRACSRRRLRSTRATRAARWSTYDGRVIGVNQSTAERRSRARRASVSRSPRRWFTSRPPKSLAKSPGKTHPSQLDRDRKRLPGRRRDRHQQQRSNARHRRSVELPRRGRCRGSFKCPNGPARHRGRPRARQRDPTRSTARTCQPPTKDLTSTIRAGSKPGAQRHPRACGAQGVQARTVAVTLEERAADIGANIPRSSRTSSSSSRRTANSP